MNEQNALINKNFGTSIVRLNVFDGEPLFVAKDVCNALGYKNARDAVAKHCKGVVKRYVPTSGGNQNISLIPESDIYRLVMRSKLPSAERFQDWVCEEVLPEIRKTGTYEQGEKQEMPFEATGDPISDMLKIMLHQRDDVLKLQKQADEMQERLKAIETCSIPDGWNTIGELARKVGISNNKALEIIAAYSVPKKRIPQSGEHRVTHVTVAGEVEFLASFDLVKSESNKIENSSFYKHQTLGRFVIRESVLN